MSALWKKYNELLTTALNDVDLNRQPENLYQPISYTLSLGGKRIRPTLCLLASDLFGADISGIIPAALGLEIFHNFTLVHDDIMDEAPLRRGKATVHEKWNKDTAILSGDVMLVKAYEQFIKCEPSKLSSLLQLFNETAIGVCEGQQLDMNFESEQNVSLSSYLYMIELKTAILLACCLKMGAILADADESDANLIYTFGKNIGIAFQIQDDYLDAYGDVEKFGKKPGGDILNNKKTFLLLTAYDKANKQQYQQLKILSDTTQNDDEKIKQTLALFDELEVRKLCQLAMDDYYQKAMTAIQEIKVEEHKKQALIQLANDLMKRAN